MDNMKSVSWFPTKNKVELYYQAPTEKGFVVMFIKTRDIVLFDTQYIYLRTVSLIL